ncbi:hypothetical protein MNB_SV-4-1256 [hydrothermal vent metagenome]|uniref:Uncharacterized protein n=1 Tax=hydrothermal vent metagenome TaxID=652676 RepID=A0A1W1E890_9ZZZZ
MIKLIIFAAVGLYVYKLLGGQLPGLGKKKGTPKRKDVEGDTMVECSKCGTYVSVEETTLINGKYYCSECA